MNKTDAKKLVCRHVCRVILGNPHPDLAFGDLDTEVQTQEDRRRVAQAIEDVAWEMQRRGWVENMQSKTIGEMLTRPAPES